jgi:hypothetical protein
VLEPEAPPVERPITAIPAYGATRRVIESAIIAVATSATLYLVGSVYTEAYYGRMSIDVTSLDLAPPFIALQATHVVTSLLQYPTTLLIVFGIYRMLSSQMPRLRSWYDRVYQRLGRLLLLVVNVLIVSPLLVAAIRAGSDLGMLYNSSVLSEVATLLETFGFLLLVYVIWLSFGPRLVILSQIREHKPIPIALIFIVYLLDSLIATAHGAALDAELLMTGQSDTSIEIAFTTADGVRGTLPQSGLLLVTARGGNYYVVEQQSFPPSVRPIAYVVPFDSVDVARLQRLNAADVASEDEFLFGEDGPLPPAIR